MRASGDIALAVGAVVVVVGLLLTAINYDHETRRSTALLWLGFMLIAVGFVGLGLTLTGAFGSITICPNGCAPTTLP